MNTDSTEVIPAVAGIPDRWSVPMAGETRFSWQYDGGRERLLALYQKGKDHQWDAQTRISWELEVDPSDVLGTPDSQLGIYGSRQWERLSPADRLVLRQHAAAWEFSQFLHGEQGAVICAARIVESVPDLDAKFYAATQVMDEARHVEIFAKFLREKIGLEYPVNASLQSLLGDALTDSRWDMPYVAMQVLIEGLALAAFGVLRDHTNKPLPRQILAYIMQDEARHVAFGRMALRDYYPQLTAAERAEREDFIIEGCYLMRDRFRMSEVWEHLGYDTKECAQYMDRGPRTRAFRRHLFSRIVPCVRDIGLWSPRVRSVFADMGVLGEASRNLDEVLLADENEAARIDAEKREFAARQAEVAAATAAGVQAGAQAGGR